MCEDGSDTRIADTRAQDRAELNPISFPFAFPRHTSALVSRLHLSEDRPCGDAQTPRTLPAHGRAPGSR